MKTCCMHSYKTRKCKPATCTHIYRTDPNSTYFSRVNFSFLIFNLKFKTWKTSRAATSPTTSRCLPYYYGNSLYLLNFEFEVQDAEEISSRDIADSFAQIIYYCNLLHLLYSRTRKKSRAATLPTALRRCGRSAVTTKSSLWYVFVCTNMYTYTHIRKCTASHRSSGSLVTMKSSLLYMHIHTRIHLHVYMYAQLRTDVTPASLQ
jgi:hypothetical protein